MKSPFRLIYNASGQWYELCVNNRPLRRFPRKTTLRHATGIIERLHYYWHRKHKEEGAS